MIKFVLKIKYEMCGCVCVNHIYNFIKNYIIISQVA